VTGRNAATAAVVAGLLLGYPVAVLADGLPTFPSRDECAHPAKEDGSDLEVVYGRLDDPVAADDLLAELNKVGFIGAEVEFDACGRWKVSYDAIDSLAQGEALAEQVRGAGFAARVEHER
jgi:hypothetical protein